VRSFKYHRKFVRLLQGVSGQVQQAIHFVLQAGRATRQISQ
jgi:hypothetical protein